ncbi:transposase [Streptomyces sp. G-G2]|uniref:transposase n=1 Tax=Streptomyces sp. G-G2 TaxID=3046201 RepID=UPI0024B8EDF4|nr:transposase [Streptomyces sp. G-G2]MDJ0383204.1 transposase [Streptomyces sp. G-G2]
MARPSKYSTEFRSDAVALWRASAGRRTYREVAADLNVNPETLRTWVRDADAPPAASDAGLTSLRSGATTPEEGSIGVAELAR